MKSCSSAQSKHYSIQCLSWKHWNCVNFCYVTIDIRNFWKLLNSNIPLNYAYTSSLQGTERYKIFMESPLKKEPELQEFHYDQTKWPTVAEVICIATLTHFLKDSSLNAGLIRSLQLSVSSHRRNFLKNSSFLLSQCWFHAQSERKFWPVYGIVVNSASLKN